MKTWVVFVVAASGAACSKPRWNAKVATELQIAGVTIAIPDGWRSLAELADGQPEGRPAPGSVGMMPEADREGVLTASVVVSVLPLEGGWKGCAEAVADAKASFTFPISDVRDRGEACTWRVDLKRLVATVGIRKVGEQKVAVQCLIDASGDPAAERVCSQVLATLKM